MNIKPELQEEYDEYVRINNEEGGYSQAVIKAGHIFMHELDEGKSPEDAEAKVMSCNEELGGLSGAQMEGMVSAAVHFHGRGQEVEDWWVSKGV